MTIKSVPLILSVPVIERFNLVQSSTFSKAHINRLQNIVTRYLPINQLRSRYFSNVFRVNESSSSLNAAPGYSQTYSCSSRPSSLTCWSLLLQRKSKKMKCFLFQNSSANIASCISSISATSTSNPTSSLTSRITASFIVSPTSMCPPGRVYLSNHL